MEPDGLPSSHANLDVPSAWIQHWASQLPSGATVLDVACGGGRHARFFAARGHPVAAVDRDPAAIAALSAVPGVTALCADIEGGPWPYAGRQFSAVVVTNYLCRSLFPALIAAVAPGGLLIYETFADGNAAYGRPANPDFLLRRGELLEWAQGMQILGFEDLTVEQPKPAVVQRICAVTPV